MVYEAEDRELGRPVALKVYHRPDRDRAQLLHEARVAVALAGRGIVRVLRRGPGAAAGSRWSGRRSGRCARAAPVTGDARAAGALGRAAGSRARARARRRAGCTTTSSPPTYCSASPDDPLLTDFGTARRTGEPSPPGSLGYVSPERLAGRASDPRDDVYGFGRVLEDALDASPPARRRGIDPAWRARRRPCTGPDAERPADGRADLAAS